MTNDNENNKPSNVIDISGLREALKQSKDQTPIFEKALEFISGTETNNTMIVNSTDYQDIVLRLSHMIDHNASSQEQLLEITERLVALNNNK